jgi:hypothetical protein
VITIDVERVLVGGGVAAAGDVIGTPLLAELARLRSVSGLIDELLPDGTVELLPADSDAVAWGGVALARRALDEAVHSSVTAHPDVEEVVARASGT